MKLVTAAIIFRDGNVLLTRRKQGERLSGHWEFPGGKVEEGESPTECLERELFEELGVKAKAEGIVAESEYHYEHGSIRLLALSTKVEETEFSLKVHDRADWVPVARLLDYKLAPADIPIARVIMETNGHIALSNWS